MPDRLTGFDPYPHVSGEIFSVIDAADHSRAGSVAGQISQKDEPGRAESDLPILDDQDYSEVV